MGIRVNIPSAAFNPVYLPYLNNMARVQIFYGGAGSGKSVFKAQCAVIDVLAGGRNYLVCRAVQKDSRRSTFVEVQKVIGRWGLWHYFKVNKVEMVVTCVNDYQIRFTGLDDPEKLKSITFLRGVLTDIWVEEATQTQPSDISELKRRQRGGGENSPPKRLTLTFNPIIKTHHIYKAYFSGIEWADDDTSYDDGNLSILKTWHIHNKWLTQADKDDLLGIKDDYERGVYAFGNWGVLGNAIFRNWSVADLSGRHNEFANHRHGLDFGFSNDPAALVLTHYDRKKKTIYIYDELYERGLTNDILASEVNRRTPKAVACDSAEPKSIVELKRHGTRAYPVKKGKDSVLHGIQWLRQQRIIIDKRCVNAKHEFETYRWRKDKDGNAMRQPVDKNNHIIDALRYAYERDAMALGAKALW